MKSRFRKGQAFSSGNITTIGDVGSKGNIQIGTRVEFICGGIRFQAAVEDGPWWKVGGRLMHETALARVSGPRPRRRK